MTGTNSSNDMVILRQNVEIYKFQWIFFMQRNFPGMKSSTTWLGNIIAQSPRKLRDISNTYSKRFIMVYRMIIDVILHLFIICYDLWCQLPFLKQGKSEGFDSCDRPSNLKLDSNRQFFRPCDREIWWMTLQNNRAPLLCYLQLCASFRTHCWIQT